MSTIRWIALLAALLLCALIASALVSRPEGRVARVYQDGRLIREIDLQDAQAGYEFRLECADGYNVIAVRPGGIRVVEADCPDNTCVKQGWLEGGITPVVCLPHGLVIRVGEPEDGPEPELDAVSG